MNTIQPIVFAARTAHRSGKVRYDKKGSAVVRLGNKIKVVIPRDQQYDVTQATIFGLNERLTSAATSPKLDKKGVTLRDKFNLEWQRYTKAVASAKGFVLDYGVYAYYPERGDLVRYCDPYWHRVVAVASSSKLITDPKGTLSWQEIQEIFQHTTIAVAGGSVGNNIAHAVVMDMRPAHLKIADKSLYKMENINRVRLRYSDTVDSNARRMNHTDSLLRNKAQVTASQIYAMDPFIKIHLYDQGINSDTVKRFFDGGTGEPKTDVIIEEVDDPRIKVVLREEARRRRIPLVMASDLGSCVQVDIARYDRNNKEPLTYGSSDKALKASMEAVYAHPGNRKKFFEFVDALVGTDYRQDELAAIINEQTEIPTSTIIPQLGSTAAAAGGFMAELVARIRLGHDTPKRALINKRTFTVRVYQ